jgi:hypothetical protein
MLVAVLNHVRGTNFACACAATRGYGRQGGRDPAQLPLWSQSPASASMRPLFTCRARCKTRTAQSTTTAARRRSRCRHGLADLFRYLTADMAFISPHLTCIRTLILGCVASCRLCRCADLDHDDACSTLHPLTLRLCRLHPSLRATKRIALHRRIPSLQDSCLRYA